MEIIDVICQIPGFNIKGKMEKMKMGYRCNVYESEPDNMLYEWVESICEEIIERNNIDVTEIGVIINSSICLYETTAKKNTSAPGVGYHVQKSLDAENAFVFETFYTDWGNMMQIASNFMTKTKCKYALLLQTNKFSNTLKDYYNGFSIPDGISIMLLKKSDASLMLKNYPLMPFVLKKASFEFNANNKDLLEKDLLFRLQWNYDPDVVKEINKQLNVITNSLQGKEVPVLVDYWFKEHREDNAERSILGNAERESLAMHTIPCNVRKNWNEFKNLEHYAFVSFNPFSCYYSVLKISRNEN
ncbi:hypothetical protein [Flavobacterium hercynium]|nr:hypothetical protein [Flavobacterium hercynium]